MDTQTQTPPVDRASPRLAYSILEAKALSGLSRSLIYRLIERGELQTVKCGGRRLVPVGELRRLCGAEDGDEVPA
jgi:excisionase family DNA binding protein